MNTEPQHFDGDPLALSASRLPAYCLYPAPALLSRGTELMSRAFVFWFLMLLWLVLSLYWYWPTGAAGVGYLVLGIPLLIFVLFALLGWQVFGAPVK